MEKLSPNSSPRERFASSLLLVKAHREMVGSDAFSIGVDFALMEYQRMLSQRQPQDMTVFAMNGAKLQGVSEFLDVLKMLAETPKLPPRPAAKDNLSHLMP